jgi:hypothetical protein
VYLGGTYISNIVNTNKSKNDFTTFLFASLVGGRNVRIDQATEKDPYIFIDSRFYTFKPYSYYVNFINNKTLQTIEETFASNDVFLKTIIKSIEHSNGDITINTKNIEGDSKLVIHTDKLKNELILKAADYNLKNTTDSDPKSLALKILTKKSKDNNNNTVFHINKLIEGNCLKLEQIIEFTWAEIFSSSSSSSFSISTSSDSSNQSSSSKISSSSSTFSSSSSIGSFECCDLMRVTDFIFNLNPLYTEVLLNVDISFNVNECAPGNENLRKFSENNVNGYVGLANTKVYFPENIYNIATNNYFWSYRETQILSNKQAKIIYNLLENAFYTTGVRLYDINYIKKSPNLIRHEIVTPSDKVFDTYNNLPTNIPIEEYTLTCFTANVEIFDEIFSALEENLNFRIDTEYNNIIQTLYFNTASFIRDSVVYLGNGLYKVTYFVEDNYDISEDDGILEVIVQKCYSINNFYANIGQLEITVESCCDDNDIFEDFDSNSSQSSVSSGNYIVDEFGTPLVDEFGNLISYIFV